MDLTVTVTEGSSAELRDLYRRLTEEARFRGRVRLGEGPPAPGTLGPVVEAVQILLGTGGTAGGVVGIVITWLRHRSGEFTVRLTRGDREVEISGRGMRTLRSEELSELIGRVTAALDEQAADDE
ncbi:effector-associated constant component EACC1 [Streptosporangium sandarakinum]|uniref:effector-associated constant component EACC1 n=1 Tax=Streptosporangium sandarakinum TaxID=1260955 RepID=UPI003D8F33C9